MVIEQKQVVASTPHSQCPRRAVPISIPTADGSLAGTAVLKHVLQQRWYVCLLAAGSMCRQ